MSVARAGVLACWLAGCATTPAMTTQGPAPTPSPSPPGLAATPPASAESADESATQLQQSASIESSIGEPHVVRIARVIEPHPAIAPEQQVVFEPPYKLGQLPYASDPEQAVEQARQLARWNEGGRAGGWHPAPRVVVDNVQVRGKAKARNVLRDARKYGYWPIRKCFDAALVNDPELDGKVRIRFTLRSNGRVSKPHLVGRVELADKPTARCLAHAFDQVSFSSPGKGNSTVTLDVAVHPGDAPVRPVEDPPVRAGPGRIDVQAVQALLAAEAGARIQQCYEQGRERVPGLWGRLALRADVDADGIMRDLLETESTFPDPVTSRCVQEAIIAVPLPRPSGGDLRLVIPLRLGLPR